ncbi:hypothetical protein BKA65DRAFT_414371 [Rhexocercosporidium sp. MPI-PUGE-AT-0058]|nr:hypothetical protein BKA65DRAFT_414371 [Rhexocercosporidium sp. MPI-PUGE-AT-0058]
MLLPRHSILLFLSTLYTHSFASPISVRNETINWNFPEIPPSTSLTWYPCYSGHFCAMLDVPLDYLNPKLGRAFVPIIKKPAVSSNYKGIVFLNPGGPSESGVQFLLDVSDEVKDAVGSDYDFAAWEPRGIGYSIPAVNNCQPPDSNLTKSKRSLDNLKIYGPNMSLEDLIDADTLNQVMKQGEDCARYMGGPLDAGPHMTTATVVRDLITIVDAYAASSDGKRASQDPKLLNYWGFSYGTIIGQTFASMFPDRLGRVVIDGVVDPDLYIAADINALYTIDQDKVFSTFFLYCHQAGPTLCPFYTGKTPVDIYNRFESMLSDLNFTYAKQQHWENATAMISVVEILKDALRPTSYDPMKWFPVLGTGLVTVDTYVKSSNLSSAAILDILSALSAPSSGSGGGDPGLPPGDPTPLNSLTRFLGVACPDTGNRLFNSSFEEYTKRLAVSQRQSWIGGTRVWQEVLPCLGWSIRSDDVFEGPFGGRTGGRFLAVGNRLDPVTPLVKYVSLLFCFTGLVSCGVRIHELRRRLTLQFEQCAESCSDLPGCATTHDRGHRCKAFPSTLGTGRDFLLAN